MRRIAGFTTWMLIPYMQNHKRKVAAHVHCASENTHFLAEFQNGLL
jgi:hypothetical protein